MAGEIQIRGPGTGFTLYALIRNAIDQIWNTGTSAFESFNGSNYANYVIALVGDASGFYAGNMPSAIGPGVYSIVVNNQLGGSPLVTDPYVGGGDLQWGGSTTLPLAALAQSGQVAQIAPLRAAYGCSIANFPFKLVSAADNKTPMTSGVVSGQISRNGGAFGALQSGAFTEIGQGWYALQALTSGDMQGTTIALSFNGVSVSGANSPSNSRDFVFVTQKVSGIA
jgi:hypothetical protein